MASPLFSEEIEDCRSWGQWAFAKTLEFVAPKFNVAGLASTIKSDAVAGEVSPPAALKPRFNITTLAGMRTHVLGPANGEQPTIVIFACHGGAYAANLWPQHFQGYTKLADALGQNSTTLYLLEYPRIPSVAHKELFGGVEAAYRAVATAHAQTPIVIVGDSAGGGMALILTQRLADAKSKGDAVKQPASLGLFSPWLDVAGTAEEYGVGDPFLTIEGLKAAGQLLAGTGASAVKTDDAAVSPLFGSLKGLPPVTVFTSTRDLLYPDSSRLRDRFKLERVPTAFRYREKTGLLHDYFMWGGKGDDTIRELAVLVKQDCGLQ